MMSPSGLHLNKPLIVSCVGVVLTVFIIYRYSQTFGITKTDKLKQVHSENKMAEKVDSNIPLNVQKLAQSTSIEDKTVQINFKNKTISVFYITPSSTPSKGISILLLHGQSFTSANWKQLGTVALLGAAGYKVIAVDLPGYGKSSADPIAMSDRGAFLTVLIKSLAMVSPVIISPSMSGSFALPYLFDLEETSVLERARAYVPVAPVITEQFIMKYPKYQIPTLIVRGENDTTIGTGSENNLKMLPKSQVHVIEDAGHACYMNQPAEFHEILYTFLDSLGE